MIELSVIQTLTEECIRLLSTTEKLRVNELTKEAYKYAEELFPLLRKLFIASMMHNKHLICISGLQGAGKTTLMKNFYGISDDFMNVSLGRGERIPVLITEGNVTEPNARGIIIDKNAEGNYFRTDNCLNKDEIINATKGEDPRIMYMEITVPYKHTNNDSISFMLLPGFEKKNEYWNDLIEFSVNSSDAAVFVFNETSFSNADNEGYLNRIEEKFGSNIVYAISGADSSLDDNAQVKETCMNVLNVKESDRVVCVGQYNDAEKNNAWIAAFRHAIDKYAKYENHISQKTSEYIYKDILSIKDTLYHIFDILNNAETLEGSDDHNHKLLKAYDKVVSEKRKALARNIADEFKEARDISIEKAINQINTKPKLKSLKQKLFGINIKEQYLETQNIIKSSLKDNTNCLPDLHMGRAIEKSIRSIDSPDPKMPNQLQLLVDIEESKDRKKHLLVEGKNTIDTFHDVCELVRVPDKNKKHEPLQHSDSKRILRAVAEITTYYYGLESYNDLAKKTSGLVHYVPAESKQIGKDIIDSANSSKDFAVGLLGVMGIDALADGSLNFISQIATSCGVALPYAAAGAILIVGVGAASAVMKDINRMQRADAESAMIVINAIYDNVQRKALERFDEYTNMVRERIEDNLADLNGERKVIVNIYNAKVYVNRLIDMLENIKEEHLPDVNPLF